VEKYEWYNSATKPNYLHYSYSYYEGYFSFAMVKSVHKAPGRTEELGI